MTKFDSSMYIFVFDDFRRISKTTFKDFFNKKQSKVISVLKIKGPSGP